MTSNINRKSPGFRDRVILEFACDGHVMGSEFETDTAPAITVRTAGTRNIGRIEIKKNSAVMHAIEFNGRTVELAWKDPDCNTAHGCYYYVRVVQANGEEAISSPVGVN